MESPSCESRGGVGNSDDARLKDIRGVDYHYSIFAGQGVAVALPRTVVVSQSVS